MRSKDTVIGEIFCLSNVASIFCMLVCISCYQLGSGQQIRWLVSLHEVQVGHAEEFHIPHCCMFLATGSHLVTHFVIQICQERVETIINCHWPASQCGGRYSQVA